MTRPRPVFLLWTDDADWLASQISKADLLDRVEVIAARQEEVLDASTLERVDALYAKFLPSGVLDAMPRLKWLQAEAAGVDRFLRRPDLREDILLTSGRGIHRLQMPDTIIGAIFYTTKPFVKLAEHQQRREWVRTVPRSVGGQTLAIFGLGAIGAELARKATALEMRVIGVNRSGRAVEHVDRVYRYSDRRGVLLQADHVVLLLPLTPETANTVDKDWLCSMKSSAWLYNFSRGAMIVDEDLLSATSDGTIAGAVLDAFRNEPLDPDHPFWTAPNVCVLPHIGGLHPDRRMFIGEMVLQNLVRYLSGRPLTGFVDRNVGY